MTLNFERYSAKLTRYFEETLMNKSDNKVLTTGVVNVLNRLKIRDCGDIELVLEMK